MWIDVPVQTAINNEPKKNGWLNSNCTKKKQKDKDNQFNYVCIAHHINKKLAFINYSRYHLAYWVGIVYFVIVL